eukprot:scaffold625_cov324-Pavlova_lutheri.AAC.125
MAISTAFLLMDLSWDRSAFLTSCWVMVDPPPLLPSVNTARAIPLTSTPLCSKKFRSSEDTTACQTSSATCPSATCSPLSVATTRPRTS